ncbi:hypothetical protein ACTUVN_000738 [Pseudomonas caspiana]
MVGPTAPYPLFPPLELIYDHVGVDLPINQEVRQRLEKIPVHLNAQSTWRMGMEFLLARSRQPAFQERHYKVLCPIIESMMHWSWSIRGKDLHDWNSIDAKAFMDFIMRPPITWVATPGCSRYSKKTRQNFAVKCIDPRWRPIIRKILVGVDPGLSSRHHRNWFLTHGREYFAFAVSLAGDNAGTIAAQNPFQELSPKDFTARIRKPRTVFNAEQLSELLGIAESLTNYNEKWEPVLFMLATAVYSDIPMRALAATQTIKPTFSYFKARDPEPFDTVPGPPKTDFATVYLESRHASIQGPRLFVSPLYPGRQCVLAPQFTPYFQRYAHFRHSRDRLLTSRSFILPVGDGVDAYGYGSLIEIFSDFTAAILKTLRASPVSAESHWIGSEKFSPNASLTFAEMRESAKRAGMLSRRTTLHEIEKDTDVWPDIGVHQSMSPAQWFQAH